MNESRLFLILSLGAALLAVVAQWVFGPVFDPFFAPASPLLLMCAIFLVGWSVLAECDRDNENWRLDRSKRSWLLVLIMSLSLVWAIVDFLAGPIKIHQPAPVAALVVAIVVAVVGAALFQVIPIGLLLTQYQRLGVKKESVTFWVLAGLVSLFEPILVFGISSLEWSTGAGAALLVALNIAGNLIFMRWGWLSALYLRLGFYISAMAIWPIIQT